MRWEADVGKVIEFDFVVAMHYEEISVEREEDVKDESGKVTGQRKIPPIAGLKGFKLGYQPREVPARYRFAQAISALADDKQTWEQRAKASIELICQTFKGWQGLTPSVMRELMPLYTTDEWVARKADELTQEGRVDFEFSPEKLQQLCMKSDTMVRLGLQCAMRASFERSERSEASEGNG